MRTKQTFNVLNDKNNVCIKVNDIFDELNEENKRLNNELMFANNCLKVLNKLKTFLYKICIKYETNIESEDKQELNQLKEEFNSVIKSKDNNSNEIREIDENIYSKSEEFNIKLSENKVLLIKRFSKNEQKLSSIKPKNITEKRVPKPEDKPNSMVLLKRDPKTESYICLNAESEKSFPTKQVIKQHLKTTHVLKERKYVCDYQNCNKRFIQRNHLTQHLATHSDDRPFACTVGDCLFRAKLMKDLKAHFMVHSNIGPKRSTIKYNFDPNTESYVCPNSECQKRFITKRSLYCHYYIVHNKNKTITCDQHNCNKSFKTRRALSQHSLTHTDVKPYVCPVKGCNSRFKTEINLQNHSVVHSDIRPFKCNECEKSFKYKNSLEYHQNVSHKSEPTFKCKTNGCNQIFNSIHTLKEHKSDVHQIVNTKKTHSCDWPGCHFQTIYPRSLVIHIRVHTDERPFPCVWPNCDKRFKSSNDLRSHTNVVHKGIKAYVCTECGRSFGASKTLSRHKLTHNDLKPFACSWPGCEQMCRSKAILRLHLKSHEFVFGT